MTIVLLDAMGAGGVTILLGGFVFLIIALILMLVAIVKIANIIRARKRSGQDSTADTKNETTDIITEGENK